MVEVIVIVGKMVVLGLFELLFDFGVVLCIWSYIFVVIIRKLSFVWCRKLVRLVLFIDRLVIVLGLVFYGCSFGILFFGDIVDFIFWNVGLVVY